MREQEETRFALLRIGTEIVDVNVEGLVDFDQNGATTGIVDRARNWGEGIGIGQDRFAFLQTCCSQRDVQGIAARGTG